MIRAAAIALLVIAAGGCASGGREGGYATYDALRDAQAACVGRGGTMTLKPEGNPQSIDGYACERK